LLRLAAVILALLGCAAANASSLSASRLGVLYNLDDASSEGVARTYARRRAVPAENVIGVHLGRADVITPAAFAPVRSALIVQLPASVQSLALVWSRPYAVGCMSVTTAMAAGYRSEFCEPGCGATAPNPLFDSDDWLPADTVGWWPAMLVPTADAALAQALIERGVRADRSSAAGTVYLVRTADAARNVRAATYAEVELMEGEAVRIVELNAPVTREMPDAIGFFTGAAHVDELAAIHFLPGAVADHLTSTGGVLYGGAQMSALAWLSQGATAAYGSVSEPCNHLEKFPDIEVFLKHYLRGETVLEAYWKSVKMPGQGLFIGEPLASPYAARRR
jgi:uncharacterized protein (TIGR03790 family)